MGARIEVEKKRFSCQCRADRMCSMDEDTLAALVLAHLVEVLRLAVSTAKLVELPDQAALGRVSALGDAQEALEVSTVMLLLRSGVSWEAMASQLGVRRQSLHRRMSRKVVKREDKALNVGGLEAEWRHLLTSLGEELEEMGKMRPRRMASRRAHRLLTPASDVSEADD
jgi:hypothetical protein